MHAFSELCPKSNDTRPQTGSQVGDIQEPFPELFVSLTNNAEDEKQWFTFTYPIDLDPQWFQPKPATPSETAYGKNPYDLIRTKWED